MPIYSESDLVAPALAIIAASPHGITTSDLSKELRLRLDPSDDDLTILANRSDDKFSQKVRNLKSHETLEKKGLVTFTDGKFLITEAGKKRALEGGEIPQLLKMQGFSEQERPAGQNSLAAPGPGRRAEAAALLDECVPPLRAQTSLHDRHATAHHALGA